MFGKGKMKLLAVERMRPEKYPKAEEHHNEKDSYRFVNRRFVIIEN